MPNSIRRDPRLHGTHRRMPPMRNDMRDWYLIASIALLSAAATWLFVLFAR